MDRMPSAKRGWEGDLPYRRGRLVLQTGDLEDTDKRIKKHHLRGYQWLPGARYPPSESYTSFQNPFRCPLLSMAFAEHSPLPGVLLGGVPCPQIPVVLKPPMATVSTGRGL